MNNHSTIIPNQRPVFIAEPIVSVDDDTIENIHLIPIVAWKIINENGDDTSPSHWALPITIDPCVSVNGAVYYYSDSDSWFITSDQDDSIPENNKGLETLIDYFNRS